MRLVYTDVLVIGGGVAGIQAALDIAQAGIHVYLVEREPSIGGHMAQLDKTFPTLDCSACILTPKMVSIGHRDNINLMTLTDVEEDVDAAFAKGGAMEVFLEAKKQGQVRYLGFSAHSEEAALEAILDAAGPESLFIMLGNGQKELEDRFAEIARLADNFLYKFFSPFVFWRTNVS